MLKNEKSKDFTLFRLGIPLRELNQGVESQVMKEVLFPRRNKFFLVQAAAKGEREQQYG